MSYDEILMLLLIYGPIICPAIISFLLSKTKYKLLKYLPPLACLIVSAIFLFKSLSFECDGYELSCFGNLGNDIFMITFGVGFFFSLFSCIVLDISHKNKKTK